MHQIRFRTVNKLFNEFRSPFMYTHLRPQAAQLVWCLCAEIGLAGIWLTIAASFINRYNKTTPHWSVGTINLEEISAMQNILSSQDISQLFFHTLWICIVGFWTYYTSDRHKICSPFKTISLVFVQTILIYWTRLKFSVFLLNVIPWKTEY